MRLSSAPVARRLARGAVLPVVALAVVATTAVLPFAPAVAEEEVGSTTTTTTEVVPAEPAAPTADPTIPADPSDQADPTDPETAAPAPAGPSCTGGALGVLSGAGAINPLDGRRYHGELVAPGVLELSVLTETREVSAPVTSVALPDLAELSALAGGAPLDGGGLTFDADGRLYVVAATGPSAPVGTPGEARLYRTAAPLAATNPEATELTRTATGRPVGRIAFDSDGLLHLADATGSTVVDPTSGDVVDELTPAEGGALACGRPSQLTAVVDLPEGRADAADQFRVAVTGAGHGTDGPTGLTTGEESGVQAGGAAEAVVVPGATYDVTLTRADGSALDGYDVRSRCTGRVAEVADGAVAFTAPRAPFGRSSTCTFVLVPSADLPTGEVPTVESGADLRIFSSLLPSARTADTRDRSEVGIGLPGMGGLGSVGSILDRDRDRDRDDTDRDPGDGGIDLDGGQFGLGDQGGSRMPDTQDTDDDVLAGRGGPLDPVLPNTGGPTALAIPVGIGAVVLGALVLTRRRRTV